MLDLTPSLLGLYKPHNRHYVFQFYNFLVQQIWLLIYATFIIQSCSSVHDLEQKRTQSLEQYTGFHWQQRYKQVAVPERKKG